MAATERGETPWSAETIRASDGSLTEIDPLGILKYEGDAQAFLDKNGVHHNDYAPIRADDAGTGLGRRGYEQRGQDDQSATRAGQPDGPERPMGHTTDQGAGRGPAKGHGAQNSIESDFAHALDEVEAGKSGPEREANASGDVLGRAMSGTIGSRDAGNTARAAGMKGDAPP